METQRRSSPLEITLREKDVFDYQFELLLKEMGFLQSTISNYTSILMTVKGWTITLVGALIVFALQQQSSSMMLVSWTTIVMFWVIDATFKGIQRVYIYRYNQIEEYLRSDLHAAVGARTITLAHPAIGHTMIMRGELGRHPFLRDAMRKDTSLLYISLLLITSLFFIGSTITSIFF